MALPATVEQSNRILVLTGFGHHPQAICTMPPLTLSAVIAELPASAIWAVKDYQASDDGRHIAQAIKDGTCIAVSDGSYKDNPDTAFWIIEGTDPQYRLQGALDIPGHTSDQTPYRSELGGLYAIATMISAVCKHYGITSGSAEIACDGLSALNRITEDHHVIRPNAPQ